MIFAIHRLEVIRLKYWNWVYRTRVVVFQTSGCSATAKGLKPGHLYQFEVSAINKEGQSQPVLTGDPILAENPYRPPGQPGEPSIVDFDNKSVTLRWAKPKDDGGRPISHYIIQKKDKFGKCNSFLKRRGLSLQYLLHDLFKVVGSTP